MDSEVLIDMRNEARNKESKLLGIKYLSKINKMYHKKSSVIDALKADVENEDGDIRAQAELAITEMGLDDDKPHIKEEEIESEEEKS